MTDPYVKVVHRDVVLFAESYLEYLSTMHRSLYVIQPVLHALLATQIYECGEVANELCIRRTCLHRIRCS